MHEFPIKAAQTEAPEKGRLQIHVTSALGATPIPGAKVAIYYTGEPEQELEEVTTDASGQTETLELSAPPLEYSMEPSEQQPYSDLVMSQWRWQALKFSPRLLLCRIFRCFLSRRGRNTSAL